MAVEDTSTASGTTVSSGRRVLVGTNVLVAVVLLAGVVGVLQWVFAQAVPVRADMTSSGVNSLSDGTERLVRKLDTNLRLTSFYFETDREDEDQPKYRQAVADLLRLYEGLNRGKVAADWINPLKDHGKFKQALARLREVPRFQEEVAAYTGHLNKFTDDLCGQLGALLESEQAAIAGLGGGLGGPSLSVPVARIDASLEQMAAELQRNRKMVDEAMALDNPQYAVATSVLRPLYSGFKESFEKIGAFARVEAGKNPNLPPAELQYLQGVQERLASIGPVLEAEVNALQQLKPLELASITDQLTPTGNALLVETDADATVVDFTELWPPLRQGPGAERVGFKDRSFNGEQKLTAAILRVTHKERPAVVFVRYGGQPLFFGGFMPGQPPAPLTEMRTQLEDANFVVDEWDLKSSLTPQTIDPAPTRTIYVVLKPNPPERGQFGQDTGDRPFDETHRQALLTAIGDKGRALFVAGWAPGPFGPIPSTYEYAQYLKDTWGIDAESSTLLLRLVALQPGKYMFAPPQPIVLMDKLEVGEHVIVNSPHARLLFLPWCAPLRLDGAAPEGVTRTELVTQLAVDGIWGARDVQKYIEQQSEEFIRKVEGDPEGPFLLAAAAQKGDAKVVVIGSREFLYDAVALSKTLSLGPEGLVVRSRNPGNVTLLINSLHWLNDNEQFMNIGQPIDTAVLAVDNERTVRIVQVATIFGLPLLVVACGLVVWWVRRG
ncbi:MAG TPA: Gldg family protein [Phycisphaerae bacterium]|nr:Gldg family protein [Phycisphaerae bacterium]HNU46266.1 Gldg family protein [Phycisphaerae bacterium]